MKYREELCKLSTVELSKLLHQCYVYLDDTTKVCHLLYPDRLTTQIYKSDAINELGRLLTIKHLHYLYLVPIENYLVVTENIPAKLKLELLYLL